MTKLNTTKKAWNGSANDFQKFKTALKMNMVPEIFYFIYLGDNAVSKLVVRRDLNLFN